ncbi:YndM family protein [Virgibacillus byunsanensis]|uniref:YndM family protein n=1 Tax=Virgibacillus byunsanensis TaxID=570945 RepID=A0ABW3LIW4_9BACI
MDHVKVLVLKFIVISFTVFAIFGIFHNANLYNLFWISLLTTGVAYLVGDMFILRKFGNVTATVSDFALSFVSLWVLGIVFIEGNIPIVTLSIISAFLITCSEPFIHGYIANRFKETPEDRHSINDLQTEFAEDNDTQTLSKKKLDDPHTDK